MADFNYYVNPSDDVKQLDASHSAVTFTSTIINGGSAKGLYNDEDLLDNVSHSLHVDLHGSKVVGSNHAGHARLGTAVGSVTVAAANGRAKYSKTSHGLTKGDVIDVTDTNSIVHGPQRVLVVHDANSFSTTKSYTSGAGTVDYSAYAGTIAQMTAEKYVIRRVTDQLAGDTNKTGLRSGGSDGKWRRQFHNIEAMRTHRVATAIRAGYWNEYSGTWSTAVTSADDISTWETAGADSAVTATSAKPGELTYKEPKPLPENDDYKRKYLW